ncbi:MAG: hypothetical protein Q8P25_04580 [Candidatus Curtissbacteria bacterium]|nr:hypothetical protein [Candidatus Curtissbacteria bacterium]
MNKKIILIIAALLVVVGVGGFYAMQKSSKTSNDQTTSVNTGSNSETIQGTLKNLLSGGKSQQCTYSNTQDSASVEGTIYIADGKMRGDYKTTSNGTTTSGHMIVDSAFSYIWTDDNQGFKYPIPAEQPSASGPSGNAQINQENAPDLNQSFNYSCKGWNAENSVFTPPSSVNFQTFTIPTLPASVKNSANGASNDSAPDCSICDNIPAGAARDTCKTQLKCQ